MSRENLPKPYQQRFKGVENFLRRVAFNLGNTPSQTEVKIISCIPIDVTDLQQKIINLEKQLHEAQAQAALVTENVPEKPKNNSKPAVEKSKTDKPPAVVNTALYGSGFTKQSSTVSYCSNKPISRIKSAQLSSAYCTDCSSKAKKSNVSFVFPALTEPIAEQSCKLVSHKNSTRGNISAVNRCKNMFNTRKKKKSFGGKSKLPTHLIYYAHQTADNPFKMNNLRFDYQTNLSDTDELCLSYLNNVMRRQYDPNEGIEEFSDTSHFTRPICRETGQRNSHCQSDVCSCCHGTFQNIDNYMTNACYCEPILENLHNSLSSTKAFYDSNNYDIIPVKENVGKIIKEKTFSKKKPKANLEINCWPENLRTKQRTYPLIMNYEPQISNYQELIQKPPENLIKQKIKLQKINTDYFRDKSTNQQANKESSKSCCVDCGDTYPKKFAQESKPLNVEPVETITQINEAVATEDINTTQGNQCTQLELSSTDDSKVLTLNEIKTVLQSVLEEIKTSTKLNTSERTIKKDVVVQKGASQNSMEGDSVLLHSYTYNKSYNTNPYIASCSRQNPYGPYCFPNVPYQPIKCLQNFPVFIQPAPARHMCACYYRKTSSKPPNRQTATATSNTEKDIKKTSSKETEKLIKEIYKSIALNMDYPNKDSSSEYHNPTSSENVSTKTIDDKENKNNKITVKKDIEVEAQLSPFELHENQTKLVYTAVSTQSDNSQLSEQLKDRNNSKVFNNKNPRNEERPSDNTVVEDEEVTESGSETESDETVILEEFKQKVKRKKGFLNRMFNSVKLFKKKKTSQKHHSDIDEASDSDDYETVYSETTKSPRVGERHPHSKPKTGKTNRERLRSPYLEQEYRRQWNEYLMFHQQEDSKHSSERPCSRRSSSKPHRPVYWTNYEARSAIVDHKLPNICKVDKTKLQNAVPVSNNTNGPKEKLTWLKKHKFGVHCGEQWKNFILES